MGVFISIAVGIGYNRLDGTEEVLKNKKSENDTTKLEEIASKQNCT